MCASLQAIIVANEVEIQRLRAAIEARDTEYNSTRELCDDLAWAAGIQESIRKAKVDGVKLAANAHSD